MLWLQIPELLYIAVVVVNTAKKLQFTWGLLCPESVASGIRKL